MGKMKKCRAMARGRSKKGEAKAERAVCVYFERTSSDGKQVLKKRFVALCKLFEISLRCSARHGESTKGKFHFNFIRKLRSEKETKKDVER